MKVVIAFTTLLGIALAGVSTIKFNPRSEWVLVPDSESRLRMVHTSEINNAPESRFEPETDVVFNLLTRSNPNDFQSIPYGDVATLQASNFNPAHPTRITIHGWNGSPNARVNLAVAAAFHELGDYNMIGIDWTAAATTANYIAARNSVDDLGPFLSRYIEFLVSNGAALSDINVIGHSLGGHAAGLAGKFVTIGRINAVISLDPAGPLFSLDEPLRRVAVGDAEYVEVMHTNGNLLGFGDPIGDTDFYPNGGNTQPGCGSDLTGQCSHSRTHEFYAESITSTTGFWADECTTFEGIADGECTTTGNRITMGGEPANMGATGIFFLETEGESPFALG